MGNNEKKRIPLKEGLWVTPAGGQLPQLIGSRCEKCGELFFPKKEKGWCTHCYNRSLCDIELSRMGKIASFSIVMQQPGGGFYKGTVPFSYGCIDLPEGLRIETLFSADDFSDLQVGRDVELIIEKLYDDEEGNEVLTFKFRPIKTVKGKL